MEMKKGYFFTMDALLSLFIIAVGFIVVSNLYTSTQPRGQLDYYSNDIISLFSNTQVDEINNSLLSSLIANGTIADTDNSILEVIGIFWVTNKTDLATKIAQNVSSQLIPERYGYSIVVGGDVVYSKPNNRSDELVTHRSMITGIEKSRPVKGTSARIQLYQISNTISTVHAFLGGFVGQGNITSIISGIPADANITEMYLEVDGVSNFSLYINSISCQNFQVSSGNMTSEAWDISGCNASIIKGGDNTFTFVFSGFINQSYIGGGYISVSYLTHDVVLLNTSSRTYTFPGIDGIVNLYDGFDVPGSLNHMEMFLHYLANHSNVSNNTFYVTIGNDTVFRDNYSNSTMTIMLNNSYLSSILNYSELSNQTVPLRVGFENLSFEFIITDKGNGDAIAVTDVSGSMKWRFDNTNTGIERFCRETDLNSQDSMRLAVSKCILKTFAHDILYNITGNQIGIVSYSSDVRDVLGLGTNNSEITDTVNRMYASGSTCTSCGVFEGAYQLTGTGSVDLLNKKWKYSNSYQVVDPVDWSKKGYDDSSWLSGYQQFGFGTGSNHYVGNVVYADLWDHPDDEPDPVDFTSGIYYTKNTFGLMNQDTVVQPLSNMHFDGPSIAGWSMQGLVNLSGSAGSVHDSFPNSGFEMGDFTNWAWGQNSYEKISGTNCRTNRYAPDGARIVNSDIGDWQLLDGAFTGGGGEQVNTLDGFDSGSFGYSGMLKSSTFTVPADAINLTFRIHSEYISADNNQCDDPGGENGNRFRNTDDETANTWGEGCIFAVFEEDGAIGPSGDNLIFEKHANRYSASTGCSSGNNPGCPDQTLTLDIMPYIGDDIYVTGECIGRGAWDDGFFQIDSVRFFTGDENPYGLNQFFMIDSNFSSSGSLVQNFSSPTASPNNVTLAINHSINYTYFDGSATVYCNLTHPGTPNGETVWQESWNKSIPATLPGEGPIQETIDLTSKITSDSFNYRIECGANVNGANTVVAFDDLVISINYTKTGDDGWDWSGGAFGYSNSTMFYPGSSGELEIVASRSTSSSVSGAYGIQVMITQQMIDAMNSPGGGAWISFDYRWDARDDGGSLFETTDEVWIKGYFESPVSGKHYLGSETSNIDGDTGAEIWSANDPDVEYGGHYSQDISTWIDNGPGYYYIALGGRLEKNSNSEFGSWTFDNVQLAFTNTSGNTFFRNDFWINSVSDVHAPISFEITSDSGADVYLNNQLMDSYASAQVNRPIAIVSGDFVKGDNLLAVKLKNSDSVGRLDVKLSANITNRQKAMVIMSDGEANSCLGQFGVGTDSSCNSCGSRGCCPGADGIIDEPCPSILAFAGCSDRYAKEQLVNLSCYYNSVQNVSIYTVAFGDVSMCGKRALNLSALCDPDYTVAEPHYFESDDPEGLASIYGEIANELRIAFTVKKSQIINVQGDFENSHLYPDSYILLNYEPLVSPMVYGEIPLFFSTDDFNNCSYDVFIPSQIRPFEAQLLSYSGAHWTNYVAVENSLGTMVAFNLSRFNDNYANLGDPFPIPIPGSFFVSGESNRIILTTADNPYNTTNCSVNTTLLYTGLLNMINYSLPYSTVHPNASGCNWTIENMLGNISLLAPSDYSGIEQCFYTNHSHDTSSFDTDDSFDWAMYNFLRHLDYDNDGRIFLTLNSDDFIISSKVVRDIPYLWGPTLAEVRVWQ